jgi:cardiolipin synthase (CMP-forming)
MADKALVMTLVVTLALQGSLPPWLAALLLGRDATFALAAIYYRYASLPAPKTFARYWDFSLPSAQVHPTAVSKANTFLQLVLVGAALALPLVLPPPSDDDDSAGAGPTGGDAPLPMLGGLATEGQVRAGIAALEAVVAATTVASGLGYVARRDAVAILGTDEALKRRQGLRGRAILGSGFGAVVVLAAVLAARDMRGGGDGRKGRGQKGA